MSGKKVVVSAADILRQAKEHAKGGPKPSWVGKQVHVGKKALSDWEEYEARQVPAGELQSFGKLIVDNHDLLIAIEEEHPASIAALSEAIGRADSNVSRSLAKLEKLGVVKLVPVEGSKAKRPELVIRKMRVEVDILKQTVFLQGAKMTPA